MSRYGFTPTTKAPGNSAADTTQEVIVGWDNPLQTFFGDVADAKGDEIVNTMLGFGNFNVQTVDDLEYLIGLTIPNDIRAKLENDRGDRSEPSRLQKTIGDRMKAIGAE